MCITPSACHHCTLFTQALPSNTLWPAHWGQLVKVHEKCVQQGTQAWSFARLRVLQHRDQDCESLVTTGAREFVEPHYMLVCRGCQPACVCAAGCYRLIAGERLLVPSTAVRSAGARSLLGRTYLWSVSTRLSGMAANLHACARQGSLSPEPSKGSPVLQHCGQERP